MCVRLVDENEQVFAEEAVVEYTLRTGALALNGTLAALSRGATRQHAARGGDALVDPDVSIPTCHHYCTLHYTTHCNLYKVTLHKGKL